MVRTQQYVTPLNVDNSTLETASGITKIKDAGVTKAKMLTALQNNLWTLLETLTYTAESTTKTTSVSFAGYSYIWVKWKARKSAGTGQDVLQVRFNGSSGSEYYDRGILNATITAGSAGTVARIGSTIDGAEENIGEFVMMLTVSAAGQMFTGYCAGSPVQAGAGAWIPFSIGWVKAGVSAITSLSIVPGGAPDAITGTFEVYAL